MSWLVTAALISAGAGIYSSQQQAKQNKKAIEASQRSVADLPGHLGSTEPGKLLMDSLNRSPQGIPSDIMQNATALLTSRGKDLMHGARSDVAALGGATGTSQTPLLTDLLTRTERGISTDIGSQITDLKMKDALTRLEDQRFLDNLRLSGTQLDANMAQAKAVGQGQGQAGTFPSGLTNPTATGLLTGGNVAQGFGELQGILNQNKTTQEKQEPTALTKTITADRRSPYSVQTKTPFRSYGLNTINQTQGLSTTDLLRRRLNAQ